MSFSHPQVGQLQLSREKLLVTGTDGIVLVVYHADPGTGDADKLALLAAATLQSYQQAPSYDQDQDGSRFSRKAAMASPESL